MLRIRKSCPNQSTFFPLFPFSKPFFALRPTRSTYYDTLKYTDYFSEI